MTEARYLVNIRCLLEDASLYDRAYEKLDASRKKKVLRLGSRQKAAQSIGAGLLLQLFAQERIAGVHESVDKPQIFTLEQILEKIQDPIALELIYGDKGKPYIRDNPFYFSISHSDDYVFFAASQQEIGADIQKKCKVKMNQIMGRFFAEGKENIKKDLPDKTEQIEKIDSDTFFRLWTKKEAYGKLLGVGVLPTLDMELKHIIGVLWEEWQMPEDYWIAVCKYTNV